MSDASETVTASETDTLSLSQTHTMEVVFDHTVGIKLSPSADVQPLRQGDLRQLTLRISDHSQHANNKPNKVELDGLLDDYPHTVFVYAPQGVDVVSVATQENYGSSVERKLRHEHFDQKHVGILADLSLQVPLATVFTMETADLVIEVRVHLLRV